MSSDSEDNILNAQNIKNKTYEEQNKEYAERYKKLGGDERVNSGRSYD